MSMKLGGAGDAPGGVRVAWLILGDEEGGMAQAKRGLLTEVRSLGVTPVVVSLSEGPFLDHLNPIVSDIEVLHVPESYSRPDTWSRSLGLHSKPFEGNPRINVLGQGRFRNFMRMIVQLRLRAFRSWKPARILRFSREGSIVLDHAN